MGPSARLPPTETCGEPCVRASLLPCPQRRQGHAWTHPVPRGTARALTSPRREGGPASHAPVCAPLSGGQGHRLPLGSPSPQEEGTREGTEPTHPWQVLTHSPNTGAATEACSGGTSSNTCFTQEDPNSFPEPDPQRPADLPRTPSQDTRILSPESPVSRDRHTSRRTHRP